MKNCLNCNHHVTGNYCPNCGQSITTKKINNRSIFVDIPFSIVSIDNGFGYSLVNIVKSPVKTAKDYIGGKKIKQFRPLSFLFVITSLSYIFLGLLGQEMATLPNSFEASNQSGSDFTAKFGEFVMNYPQIFVLTTIPFAAFGQYLSNIRSKDSFAIHFYYVIYIQAFISIITFIPGILFSHYLNYTLLSILFTFIVIIWFYVNVYKHRQHVIISILKCILGMIYSLILCSLIGLILIVIGMLIYKAMTS